MMFVRLPALTGNPLSAAVTHFPLDVPPAAVVTPEDAVAHLWHELDRRLPSSDPFALIGLLGPMAPIDLLVSVEEGIVAVRYLYASELHVTSAQLWPARYERFKDPTSTQGVFPSDAERLNAAADHLHEQLTSVSATFNHIVRALVLVDPEATLHIEHPSCVDFIGTVADFDPSALCRYYRPIETESDPARLAQQVCDLHLAYVRGGSRTAARRS